MHLLQEKLLKVIDQKNIGTLTLREIGGLIEEQLPQKVKHHLLQLEKKGFIIIDKKNKIISKAGQNTSLSDIFVSVPILGSANCGYQTIYATENIEGFLKISKKIIKKPGDVFILRAEGNSLNQAKINEKKVEDGDYLLIDSSDVSPNNNDYVVSVIDGLANVKKYVFDEKNSRIVLLSESSQKFDPIFIHEDDDFTINGKVIDVIKKFKS